MKVIAVSCCFCLAIAAVGLADEPAKDLKTVKARTIELQVPASWKEQQTTSNMRAAQLAVPGDVALVVFYFGGPTGGIKANVERWIGQFQKEGREINMVEGKCKAGSYIWVDCKGTWNKPDGPPFARKTKATPNSHVVNVILIEEKDGAKDYYFLKLSGSADAVGKQAKALRTAIGADSDSEKKFDLDEAK